MLLSGVEDPAEMTLARGMEAEGEIYYPGLVDLDESIEAPPHSPLSQSTPRTVACRTPLD